MTASDSATDSNVRQVRSEQKIVDAELVVKVHNFADNTKRRIINNDGVVLVLVPLIVSARIKRTADARPVDVIRPADPRKNRLVYVRRSEAVVRCFLRFELVDKLSILIRYLLKRHLLRDVLHFSAAPPLCSVF